jgi:hypothetical protein
MPGATRGNGTDRLFTNQSEINGAVVRHPPEVVLLLVAWEDAAGKPVPGLVLRADPEERRALLSAPASTNGDGSNGLRTAGQPQ